MINWRSIEAGQEPNPDQDCLTQMKRGLISGRYDDDEQLWFGYYYQEIGWHADKWVPVEEVQNGQA